MKHFAFIGDSTFFASGLTGVANAVYNGCDLTIVVLDNSTTAMTGGQPHPGTGSLATGAPAPKIDIEGVLLALGVGKVVRANPFRLREAMEKVREAAAFKGVSAVLFESPCINLAPGRKRCLQWTPRPAPAAGPVSARSAAPRFPCVRAGRI